MFALKRFARPSVSPRFGNRCFSQIQLSNPNVEVKQKQLFINGKYVDSISGKTMATLDPRNEDVICQVSEADIADVNVAVKVAREAFNSGVWSTMSGFRRSRVLHKWADLIERDMDYVCVHCKHTFHL